MNHHLRGATIVFDLDGTLVDTAPDLAAATNHVITTVGGSPMSVHDIRPFISFGARWMIVEALKKNRIKSDDHMVDDLLTAFLVFYRQNIAVDSRPYDGAEQALDTLATQGARLAVCTNKREELSRRLLRELGLLERFDAVVGRDTLDVFKPHPGHILGTIERAGGVTDQAIMVGDSANDIDAANAAQIPSIAVSYGYSSTPPKDLGAHCVIDSFAELMPAIVRLRSR